VDSKSKDKDKDKPEENQAAKPQPRGTIIKIGTADFTMPASNK
jgi:hypothetical protein